MEHAYDLYEQGVKPSYSCNIADVITAGYGKLDYCGEWEFPLIVDQETLKVLPNTGG